MFHLIQGLIGLVFPLDPAVAGRTDDYISGAAGRAERMDTNKDQGPVLFLGRTKSVQSFFQHD